MPDTTDSASPQAYARTAGWLYLIVIVAAGFAEAFVRGNLIVYRDAAATATNIVAHEWLFRMGFASDLVALVCDVAVALLLFVLLRPVDETLALLAASFRLVTVAILGLNALNHLAALLFLSGARYLTAFSTDQLHALAYLYLKAHAYGYDIGLVFFSCHCLILGYLIVRSGYLPKTIGALMAIAGLCYLANSFVDFLAPAYALPFAVLLPAGLAELSLCLWLIVVGVNLPKWEEKTGAMRRPR